MMWVLSLDRRDVDVRAADGATMLVAPVWSLAELDPSDPDDVPGWAMVYDTARDVARVDQLYLVEETVGLAVREAVRMLLADEVIDEPTQVRPVALPVVPDGYCLARYGLRISPARDFELVDAATGETVGPATKEQARASFLSEPTGVILVDTETGRVVGDGTWLSQQPSVRTMFVR